MQYCGLVYRSGALTFLDGEDKQTRTSAEQLTSYTKLWAERLQDYVTDSEKQGGRH